MPTVVDFQMLCGHEESSFEIDICRLFEAFPWGFTSWYGEDAYTVLAMGHLVFDAARFGGVNGKMLQTWPLTVDITAGWLKCTNRT